VGLRILEPVRSGVALEPDSDVARACLGDHVVDRAFRAGRLEAVGVTDDPRGHEATVRAAEDAHALAVAEGKAAQRLVRDCHQVLVVDRPPARAEVARPANRPAPLLAVARGAARVAEGDRVPGAGEHLELVEELRRVLRVRPPVNVQEERIALALFEAGRRHDPGLDLGAVFGDGGKPLRLRELAPRDEGRGQLRDRLAGQVELGERCRRRSRVDEVAACRVESRDTDPAEDRVAAGAVRRSAVQVVVAVILDREHDRVAVPGRNAEGRVRVAVPVE
jgi:hypothetical protein